MGAPLIGAIIRFLPRLIRGRGGMRAATSIGTRTAVRAAGPAAGSVVSGAGKMIAGTVTQSVVRAASKGFVNKLFTPVNKTLSQSIQVPARTGDPSSGSSSTGGMQSSDPSNTQYQPEYAQNLRQGQGNETTNDISSDNTGKSVNSLLDFYFPIVIDKLNSILLLQRRERDPSANLKQIERRSEFKFKKPSLSLPSLPAHPINSMVSAFGSFMRVVPLLFGFGNVIRGFVDYLTGDGESKTLTELITDGIGDFLDGATFGLIDTTPLKNLINDFITEKLSPWLEGIFNTIKLAFDDFVAKPVRIAIARMKKDIKETVDIVFDGITTSITGFINEISDWITSYFNPKNVIEWLKAAMLYEFTPLSTENPGTLMEFLGRKRELLDAATAKRFSDSPAGERARNRSAGGRTLRLDGTAEKILNMFRAAVPGNEPNMFAPWTPSTKNIGKYFGAAGQGALVGGMVMGPLGVPIGAAAMAGAADWFPNFPKWPNDPSHNEIITDPNREPHWSWPKFTGWSDFMFPDVLGDSGAPKPTAVTIPETTRKIEPASPAAGGSGVWHKDPKTGNWIQVPNPGAGRPRWSGEGESEQTQHNIIAPTNIRSTTNNNNGFLLAAAPVRPGPGWPTDA